MEINELQCPRCSSNQLTTSKQGFSGGKALAGVLVTGGIGLLAGTIGSKKTKIFCMACGHTFKPGEDKAAVEKIKQSQAEQIKKNKAMWKKPWVKWTFIVMGVIFILLMLLVSAIK